MARPALHIVMPVLNEAAGITAALQSLQPLLARGAQLVVVDGGSEDDTLDQVRAWAAQQPGMHSIAAPRGRALQMDAGARWLREQAGEGTLLFLHADTTLPPEADKRIAHALADGQRVWGRFDVRIDGQHWLLPVIAFCMNWRSRLTGIATGDQAIFMTHAAFDAVGGLPAQPLMEDIDLSARLKRVSRPACLHARVSTSGRRWETRGVWRTMALMWRLRLAYWRGVAPERLATLYR